MVPSVYLNRNSDSASDRKLPLSGRGWFLQFLRERTTTMNMSRLTKILALWLASVSLGHPLGFAVSAEPERGENPLFKERAKAIKQLLAGELESLEALYTH